MNFKVQYNENEFVLIYVYCKCVHHTMMLNFTNDHVVS